MSDFRKILQFRKVFEILKESREQHNHTSYAEDLRASLTKTLHASRLCDVMATGSRFDVLDDEVAVRANPKPALALEEAVSYAVVAATGKKQATSVSAGAGNLSDGAFIGEIVTKVLAAIQPIIIQSVTQAVAAAMKVAMEQFQPNRSTASCSSPGILHPEVQTNRFEVDRLEQYSRRDSFKVFGVPESGPQEDTSQMVVDLAKEIGVELRRDDISVSHRVYVSKKSSKPRPIIAKMVRREKKVEVMKAKKRLRELNDRKDIFIVEDLTQLRVKLVRELRKEPRVEKVWTIDGKVFCLVKDGAKRVKQMIDSPDDLHKIGWSEERMTGPRTCNYNYWCLFTSFFLSLFPSFFLSFFL